MTVSRDIDPKGQRISRMLSEEINVCAIESIFQRKQPPSSGKLLIGDIFSLLSSNDFAQNNQLDPQLLLLLKGYAEENPGLELSYEELNLLLSELTSSLSLRFISKSLPEAPDDIGFAKFTVNPHPPSRRKSLLATRRRTNPLPDHLEIIPGEEVDFNTMQYGSPIPRNRFSMGFRNLNHDGFDSRASSPGLGLTHSPASASRLNRMSVGFETSQEYLPLSANSEKTVRKVTSELSRKLANEKGLYSTLAQETKVQISELEAANESLKDKLKDLTKTLWDIKTAKQQQDRVLSVLEEETATFHEKESSLKKEVLDLKRISQEKSMTEKKLQKDLTNFHSRLAESDVQIYQLLENQKRLAQEKSKQKQLLLRLKRDNDRLGLELHQKELLYMEKINKAEIQDSSLSVHNKTTEMYSDGSVTSVSNSPLLEAAKNNFKVNSYRAPASSRKKIKTPQAAINRNKLRLRDALETIYGLWEEAKDILAQVQSDKTQDLFDRFSSVKDQLKLRELRTGEGSPLKTRAKNLIKEYPVLSARGGYKGRPNARRGSSANVSPKRLSMLLPPSKLHQEHTHWKPDNSSFDEAPSIAPPKEELLSEHEEPLCCLPSPDTPVPTGSSEVPLKFADPCQKTEDSARLRSYSQVKSKQASMESFEYYSSASQGYGSTSAFSSSNKIYETFSSRHIASSSSNRAEQGGALPHRLVRHERSISDFSTTPKFLGYIQSSFKRKGIAMKSYASTPIESAFKKSNLTEEIQHIQTRNRFQAPSLTLEPKLDDQNGLIKDVTKKGICITCGQQLPSRQNTASKKPPMSPLLPIGLPAIAVTCTDVETRPVLLSPSPGYGASISLNHLISPLIPNFINSDRSPKISETDRSQINQEPSFSGALSASNRRNSNFSYEIINLRAERAAACPPGWTRDDDDFVYEAACYKQIANPCPHRGSFITHCGKFRACRYPLA